MRKLIIEARVNEYMMRDQGNPNVPYTPEEIASDAVACREAGAAIVHFHARKPDGDPEHGAEAYADTVARIRAASDILVHPTLGYVTLDRPAEERLDHILAMAKDPARAPHFAPMDTGSVNVDRYNAQARRFETTNLVYKNSTETLTYFGENIRAAGLKPYLVSWNVGFTRYATAFMEMGLVDEPAYLCFCLTDNTFLGGHPGTLKGLQAHLDFLPPDRRVEWTVCNFGGNLFALAATIISLGGHVSIGLGDYTYGELGQPRNAELVARIAEIARELGREVATPQEAKAILGMRDAPA
ncbi:3-keto-5-aminohexanoate cleavage protein [Salinarimonas ramus]|uniref:3-keto-5-aminohexanoate cleavage protein n=1 Tax=Salinarimonas ramus TaxID=690164 RepID=A0A917Q4A4_9HYPH|nr:3-keto-5-aminohexanoate cleavage protein [Salinarimonas ramus]GGK20526.1 3-keto-5-aminohexanoate cleavage protein [Salinarimonas ramus]